MTAAPAGALTQMLKSSFTHAESLWDRALERLGKDDRQRLQFHHGDKLDVLNEISSSVKRKKQECLDKRWAFTKRNGERIIFRDLCEKIIVWVDKFKEIGDVAVQFDPTHSALPWAAVRFVLQATVNDHQIFCAMLEGVEHVSHMITRYTIIEAMYLGTSTATKANGLTDLLDKDLKDHLRTSLVKLYATILEYLARAGLYFNQKTPTRMLKSVIDIPEKVIKGSQDAIAAQESEVHQCFQSVGQESLRVLFNQNEETHSKLDELRKALEQPIIRMATEVTALHDSMKKEDRRELLRWLSVVPHRQHHGAVRDRRLPNSGEWLLQKDEFTNWEKSSSSSVLWLHGIPGSGKTFLTSLVVDHMANTNPAQSTPVPSAFFYCNRNPAEPQRSDPDEILRSILKQLCARSAKEPIRDPVATTFRKRKDEADDDGSDVTKLSLHDCTSHIIRILDKDPCIIVIDAMDECDPARRHELLGALDHIIQSSPNLVKVFVSSRDDADIVRKLEQSQNVYITASENSTDIGHFVQVELQNAINNGKLLHGNVSDELRKHIEGSLLNGAQGMFSWVTLQLQNICDSQRFKLPRDVEEELGKLPRTLKGSYDIIYQNINDSAPRSKVLAKKAISLLLCAKTRLSAQALTIGISLDDPKYLTTIENILDICCNFVILDKSLGIFRFAHLSAREYFEAHEEYTKAEIEYTAFCTCIGPPATLIDEEYGTSTLFSSKYVGWSSYSAVSLPLHLQELNFVAPPSGMLRKACETLYTAAEDVSTAFRRWEKWLDDLQKWKSRTEPSPYSQDTIQVDRNLDLWRSTENGGPHNISKRYVGIVASHPFCMLVAFGITFGVKHIIGVGNLILEDEQRQICVEEAIMNNYVDILNLLISHGFSLKVDNIINSFKIEDVVTEEVLEIVANNLGHESAQKVIQVSDLYDVEEEPVCFQQKGYVAKFCKMLIDRYPDIRITETQLGPAIRYPGLAGFYLDHEPTLETTEKFLLAIMSNRNAHHGLFQKLIARCPDLRIEESELREDMAYEEAIQLFLSRIDITEDAIITAMSADTITKEDVKAMLKNAPGLRLSSNLLRIAMVKGLMSYETARIIIDQKHEVEFTDELMEIVIQKLDLHTIAAFITLVPGLEISGGMVRAARANWGKGTKILELFRHFDVIITQETRDAVVECFGIDFVW